MHNKYYLRTLEITKENPNIHKTKYCLNEIGNWMNSKAPQEGPVARGWAEFSSGHLSERRQSCTISLSINLYQGPDNASDTLMIRLLPTGSVAGRCSLTVREEQAYISHNWGYHGVQECLTGLPHLQYVCHTR